MTLSKHVKIGDTIRAAINLNITDIQFQPDKIWCVKYFGILIILVFLSFSSVAQTAWSFEKEEDNIKIYTKEIKNSSFKAFKGITVVKSNLHQLLAIFADANNYTNWFHDCINAHSIEKTGDKTGYTYMEVELPWPLENRDIITKFVVNQNIKTKTVLINLTAAGKKLKKKDGLVRVYSLNGFWEFKPLNSGKIEITYQLHFEPRGTIPAWLANSSVIDAPYNTLKNMKLQLNKDKYKRIKYDWLKD